MHNYFGLTLVIWLGAMPAWAEETARPPSNSSREFQIPSERMLEQEFGTSPRNNFSTNNEKAIKQMDQSNKEIDRLVEKGICTGC